MRYISLDVIRALSVGAMILFHSRYLLENVFAIQIIPLSDNFWRLFGLGTAISFIMVAGMVSVFSYNDRSLSLVLRGASRRFFLLAASALIISLITYIFFYEERISWGIIHFFAFVSLLGVVTYYMRFSSLLVGLLILLISYTDSTFSGSFLLIPIGFPPDGYYSADYYPLIPWFGYFLLGQSLGWLHLRYPFLRFIDGYFAPYPKLAFVGRNALIIYMIHVPILYSIFWLINLSK